jgi:hypothetical protein
LEKNILVMKTLTLLLSFVLFTALQTYAQIDSEKLLYLEKAEKYRKMKGTGRGLVIIGSAAAVIGLVTMMSATDPAPSGYGSQTSSTGKAESGAVIYLLGNVAAGVGVPLWIVGGVNEGRYNRKADALAVRMNINPQGGGVSFSYRLGK